MSSKSAKVAASIGGVLPATGVVAALMSDPLLLLAILGFIVTLVVMAVWLLLQRPYIEHAEISQNGVRKRLWHAGFAQSSFPSKELGYQRPSTRQDPALQSKAPDHSEVGG